ncbi:hypothetical protein GTY65_09560 [Streptomyces sp. SID8379]|uniref:hypothetical protein n=1 Tax=unclassified Streptomyces TaxID=2593676 RepID=UPI00035E556A|nr:MULTISPECIES: hypothetical protein [unclassified Streptomyces]MYW64318.1 hypothetical protein [Streptomyces sp. SID8379]
MRRTATLSTATVAALLALGAPVCAAARADGDGGGWGDISNWPAATPTATATTGAGSGGLELVPADVRPGGTVTANTTACGADEAADGDASSVGAGEFTLETTTHEGDVVGRFQVPTGARPGTYPVSVTCDSGTVARQTLTVSGEGGSQLHGVHAGDGGSLGNLSTVQLVLGGALIAGSLGAAGYHVVRRRQLS